ncbi:glycine dehydrogenase (aminomethyl-transferring) [Paraphotobacterium marinum]|uniref:Glycine dehydrogenase (decarboxylating) n=1 Tax=Paraphotobacterium marinum TaxID=1755811 RepID=A0A220VF17_9GAMM|nr:aminomethyl-transferring glycine dehydrogenase [Paraphotobacterium marinum]ASK78955.1 glycine dehydrogenase (aminomethyl-transferring) [Paraphotobacterium marinum]
MNKTFLETLCNNNEFEQRHNGPDESQINDMLKAVHSSTLQNLIDETIPQNIRLESPMGLEPALSEAGLLKRLKEIAEKNVIHQSYVGQGYFDTFTPSPILRNVLENPGWYTAYTPYQPEISQGRLESLLNFQQMVVDLTGMSISNASLLDEATAAAEAMTLAFRSAKSKSNTFFVADDVHPQTIDVIKTRAKYLDIEIVTGSVDKVNTFDVFGAIFQYPGTQGNIHHLGGYINKLHENKAIAVVATDLLSLALLKPPGEFGADVVIGSSQRFGVPMGFGGPHAAFLATTDKLKRSIPGRIIGVSKDKHGNQALRMAMQTREQHIRREKATSNICTAQALLANMAAFFAVYHGPEGIKKIATRVHHYTSIVATLLTKNNWQIENSFFFDTITVKTNDQTADLYQKALDLKINLRKNTNSLSISFDETKSLQDIKNLLSVFDINASIEEVSNNLQDDVLQFIPQDLRRSSDYLQHPVFNQYHTETKLMRYMKSLENKDFSLTHGMIPLGSCTMKLNAATEMIPVTWPEFGRIHPFAPSQQVLGYQELIDELKSMLCKVTGYDAFSLQPNSGAQGEYAGLLAIQRYHASNNESHRNICLIPSSAHGTNPASAAMASLKVVVVKCDEDGNIDLADLKEKIAKHQQNISCIMITYPSTHGVYEETVTEVCELVHSVGGQVYLDGANMNAQVGLTSPGFIGSDVSHLNLHKTFCIPHGGGGPGVGPIGVKSHLAPFLPGNSIEESDDINYSVSAANFGSASILPISYAYIAMMGDTGLTKATELAILNANYMKERLKDHYTILYTGNNDRVAHECIIDIRPIKSESGISEEDIAKRLMDFGFHAPTMSFPVAGTLMVEPTESEDKVELDRFCDAMIQIRNEIQDVISGKFTLENNPLVNAPHTQVDLMTENWNYPYSREQACFPSKQLLKYWPSVNRVDNVYGDRNLYCTCPDISTYE